MTTPPLPTPILRIVHVDNLPTLLLRGGLHAPNHTPEDGLPYRTIHNTEVQQGRRAKAVSCGPGGTIHDYVPFYFGTLSVMLLNLKTGRVAGYDEGQVPIIYLAATAQAVQARGLGFVFTDGHGLANYTSWFDDLANLDEVPWNAVGARYWSKQALGEDGQRQKQAEFLVHRHLPWDLVDEIAVYDDAMKSRVEALLTTHRPSHYPRVTVRRDWYYS